jgi:hypothetical protein
MALSYSVFQLSDQGRTAAMYHRLSSLWRCRSGIRPKGHRLVTPANSRLDSPLYIHLKTAVSDRVGFEAAYDL